MEELRKDLIDPAVIEASTRRRPAGMNEARARRSGGDEWVGLTEAEAARRLATDGPNEFPRPPPAQAWRKVVSQLTHFFALMLWGAGGLAFVADMPQLGVAIFVVVVVNGIFAFIQEERAERAAAQLRELLPAGVVVRRGGA